MAAASLSTPELALDPDEAKELADAANKVASHYAVEIDPKTLAWLHLAMVGGMLYGTRIITIYARHKTERKSVVTPSVELNTVDMTPGDMTPGDTAERIPFRPITVG